MACHKILCLARLPFFGYYGVDIDQVCDLSVVCMKIRGGVFWFVKKEGDIGKIPVASLIFVLAVLIPCSMCRGTANRPDVIIVTSQEIKALKVHKISDVLNQVPGIRAGDSFVTIRGSRKVKVLLDGRPINDPTSSHGGVKFDMVSVENVERIEIYRGKGGLQYGDDASGGVIIITTKGMKATHGNIKSYLGNFRTRDISGNIRINRGAIGIGLSAGHEYTNGYQVNSDRKKERIGGKAVYRWHGGDALRLSAGYIEDDRGLAGRIEYPTPHSRKRGRMLSLAAGMSVHGVESEAFYNHSNTRNRDPDRGIDSFITVKKAGGDLRASMKYGKWISLGYGGSLRWEEGESSRFKARQEDSFSVFVVGSLRLERLPVNLSAGLRKSVYSDFPNTLNPEIKASYRLSPWLVAISYSRTNNIPSFYQRFDETSVKRPNPDLGMEKAQNFSISFSCTPSSIMDFGASLFFNRVRGRITYVLGDDGIGRYENFGRVTYKGGDFLINWKVARWLSLQTTYTYLKAIDEGTGHWMPSKPRHRLKGEIRYRPYTDLAIILSLRYDSKQYTRSDNKSSVPDRLIGNLRAEYSLPCVDFFIEAKNLWDKRYLYGDGGLAPPFTWYAGINYRF